MTFSTRHVWPACLSALLLTGGIGTAAESLAFGWKSNAPLLSVSGPGAGIRVLEHSTDLRNWSAAYAFWKADGSQAVWFPRTDSELFFRVAACSFATPSNFVWIPPGEFLMGSPTNEAGRSVDEGPQRTVSVVRGFWMSRYETTVLEYEATMGTNPSPVASGSLRPINYVNWSNAVDFCARQTARAKKLGLIPPATRYRLPTEAEWEYACRADTTTRFSFGDDPLETNSLQYAWRAANASNGTHPVGEKLPNPWGLYDIHGNVFEWCLDLYGPYPDATSGVPDGNHVYRGGSWVCPASACRSASRHPGPELPYSFIGFRVVLGAEPDTVLR